MNDNDPEGPTTYDPRLLRALCDTLVPWVDPAGCGPQEATLLTTTASAVGVDQILGMVLPAMAPHVRALVSAALEALGADFVAADEAERVSRWTGVLSGPATYPGAIILQSTILAMFYTAPDERLTNPTWPAIGYPGPLLEPPTEAQFPKTLRTLEVPEDAGVLTADAVIVGSGAGGGAAAARLAAAGLKVMVLEKGAYRNEPDLPQLEALSFPNLYLGGGFIWSTTASVGLLAGSTVGGGTTVNSMACLPPPDYVLAEWARLGMEQADSQTFGAHVASVMTRINATPSNSVHNGVNRILMRAFEAAGLAHAVVARNARDDDSRYCGECNAGCLTGCKQSTMKTFLQDASDDGALLLPRCDVQEILQADGVATGVRARLTSDDGSVRDIMVHAPVVVLAAGALATPTLLQASSLGGPAVGHNLHVHPSYFMSGVFDEVVEGWAGQILTCVSHDFDHVEGDHGFVIEAAPMGLGFWTALTAWHNGEQHKHEQLRLRHVSGIWGFARDHGAGTVRRGDDGMPLVTWELDDPIDLAVVRRCHVELAKLLKAAGAKEIFTFLPGDPRWHEGEDFEVFLGRLRRLSRSDILTLSAHQSGTCATGTDPRTSVVDGRGQLHDTRGVYIVDASALPTAPGVNPMISIEAFASKTSDHIISDRARRNPIAAATGNRAPE
ncbi:GMC family oxidoreductase N-terminal domain-containing protein [Actinomadura sp. 6N118]|uniref:GMC family oxidoreductase N-terminal domain-containing protein n=1 Tax=Actinomadura sp. 6N118 TaxID=3375151 RepID=UPI0037A15273